MLMRSLSAAFASSTSWASRHARPILALLLAFGAVLAVAQTSGSSGGSEAKKDQSAFELNPPVGGPRTAGTSEAPTAAGSLHPSHSVTALSLDDGLGGFSFTYSYTPSVAAYNSAKLTSSYQRYHSGGPTRAPFGLSPKNPEAQHFWHNLSSYVQVWVDKCVQNAGPDCFDEVTWILRRPGGSSSTIVACAGARATQPDPLGWGGVHHRQ